MWSANCQHETHTNSSLLFCDSLLTLNDNTISGGYFDGFNRKTECIVFGSEGNHIGAVAVVCLIFGGILLIRRGKNAFPFSPDYARGSDCDTIQTELKQLGFTDIKTVSDDSGWEKDNTVIGMTVDDTDAFEQG